MQEADLLPLSAPSLAVMCVHCESLAESLAIILTTSSYDGHIGNGTTPPPLSSDFEELSNDFERDNMTIFEGDLSSDSVDLSSDLARQYGDLTWNEVLNFNPASNVVQQYGDPIPNVLLK